MPHEAVCPACLQIKDGIPAGFVYIKGEFFNEHKEEIENLLTKRRGKNQLYKSACPDNGF